MKCQVISILFFLRADILVYLSFFPPIPNRIFFLGGGSGFCLLFFCFVLFCFLLYNIVLVLPYINMHPPRVYTCSPSWTPLPPPSPYHPFGSSQCTSPKHPVSCIEPGLAIHFLNDIIHVSMPFSQMCNLINILKRLNLANVHYFETRVLYFLLKFQGMNF